MSAIRNPRAYLHRSIHHGLISRHRQAARAAVPLHDLAEDEHPAHEDPEANVRTAQLSRALMEAWPSCRSPARGRVRLAPPGRPHGRGNRAQLGLSNSSVEKYLTPNDMKDCRPAVPLARTAANSPMLPDTHHGPL